MILEWRNDPYIVERSGSRRRVSAEEHRSWFLSAVGNPDCRMFIIEEAGSASPIGQVRFDREGDACVVTAYLRREFVGRGLGVEAIRKGCARIWGEWDIRCIRAEVRADNQHGQAAFRKAGFTAVLARRGAELLVFELGRPRHG